MNEVMIIDMSVSFINGHWETITSTSSTATSVFVYDYGTGSSIPVSEYYVPPKKHTARRDKLEEYTEEELMDFLKE